MKTYSLRLVKIIKKDLLRLTSQKKRITLQHSVYSGGQNSNATAAIDLLKMKHCNISARLDNGEIANL